MSLIDKIFPDPLPSVEEIEKKYAPRALPEGAKVTRIAPSPTGFMHIGGIYSALISERIAHQSGGVFYLRIEDTDTKREVEGATDLISSSLGAYGLAPDEGVDVSGVEHGNYGPYSQSCRREIYQAYIKKLLEEGRAYPCFSTVEELERIRKGQEVRGERLGYYGSWALSRGLSAEEAEARIDAGIPYVIRYKSLGDYNHKITVNDTIKGKREFPDNDLDIVIMKSDRLPTYHFAHVVDDHLMGTTDVIRGDEWMPSLPLHIQLFREMGWKVPRYAHIAPIQKMDGNSKRKLSKRKDPEASVTFYDEEGYSHEAVVEYLLNLANSNFEDWRKQNPSADYHDFPFSLKKMNNSGALFDFTKLNSVSREVIGRMSADEVFERAHAWAKTYDVDLAARMESNRDYVRSIFNIEREGVRNVRKDISKWSDVKEEIRYFFDDQFSLNREAFESQLSDNLRKDWPEMVRLFAEGYNPEESKDEWFGRMLEIAAGLGYARNGKEYKAAPENFRGDISDVVKVFRVLITGKTQSPDLYSIMRVMGPERVLKRVNAFS